MKRVLPHIRIYIARPGVWISCVSERELHSSLLLAVSSSYKTRSDNQQPSHLLLDNTPIRLLDYPLRNHAFQPTVSAGHLHFQYGRTNTYSCL